MRLARGQSANGYRTSLPTSESPPPYDQAIDGTLPSPRYEVEHTFNSIAEQAGAAASDAELLTADDAVALRDVAPAASAQVTPQSKPSFTMNGKDLTAPFVTAKTVKAHLRLLACFTQLRKDVLAYKQPELEAAGITDEDRWSIFLVRAHHRFETWISVRACEPETCELRNCVHRKISWAIY